MHSLWSRAAQAHSSCRCRLCLHTSHLSVRRSTNAVSRRKVSAADLFTACYTTILGAATVIDAKRKENRKKDLDEKLEKARAALDRLGVQDELSWQDGGSQYHNADTTNANALQSQTRGSRKEGLNATNALLRELVALCEITRRPMPRPSWMQTQLEWVHVEAAIAMEEQDPEYIFREPKSSRQLQATTTAVVDLVKELILQSLTSESVRSQDDIKMQEGDTGPGDLVLQELKAILHTLHYPSYYQPSEDADETAKNRFILGESIRRIFNKANSTREIVAKICYNLLICSAPPSIHTYNILIAGFNRIERPDLAQTIIDSYIHRTTWPATRQTIVCLLDHYRGINEVEGWRDIVLRMRGVKDDGLHYRIVDKTAIYTYDWLEWAKKNCASRKTAYVERARRDGDVFNSLIKGYLYRGELGNASMAFIASLREGGFVPVQTLLQLFMTCLIRVDITVARQLVQGFAKSMRKFTVFVKRIVLEESIVTSRQVVMSLSRILDICWFPDKHIFRRVVEVYDWTLRKLQAFITRVRIEIELQETVDLCDAMLKEIESSDSLVSRLDRATAALDSAQQSRQKVTAALIDFSKLAKILSIDRRCRDLDLSIETTTALANVITIKRRTGYDFDPSGLLTSKITGYLEKVRRKSIINALRCIQMYHGPSTQGDIKLQLLRNLPDPVLARKFEKSGDAENLTIRTLTTFYAPKLGHPKVRRDCYYSNSIRQLELDLADTLDTTKAILFAHLLCGSQLRLRYRFSNWDEMPLHKLVEYHLRGGICSRTRWLGGTQQTGITGSRDQEKPATKTRLKAPAALKDAYEAEGVVSKKPTASHSAIERKRHLSRPIAKLRSASPSVLGEENVRPPLAAMVVG
ncbi:hypothetical protein F4804DRAFT_29964 [Jackrogersella minutella]|nr:hypothetical protein F4804DRAFT_29964 [Jackrogersella minutella]